MAGGDQELCCSYSNQSVPWILLTGESMSYSIDVSLMYHVLSYT